MSHLVTPATSAASAFLRRRRYSIIGMTAAGIILTGPAAAFADEGPASTGTFGQETAPSTGAQDSASYPVVEQVAAQTLAEAEPAPVDSDGDGITDAEDAYPADPTNTAPAPQPVDSDGDGITDAQDAYPADPTNTAPAPATPAPEEPATEVPATEEPATEVPAPEEPTTEEPATEVPAPEEPTTEEPATEVPAPEEPTTEEPATEVPAPEEPTTEEPTTEEPAPAPETPKQRVYNDEDATVEVPEQYRGVDTGFSFVLVGEDGRSVSVTLDEQGRAVLTPETLDGLGAGSYTLRAVQGETTSADISTIELVDPVSAPDSDLTPIATTGSDLIGTIGDYAKGQKIVVRDVEGKVVEGLNVVISDNGFYVLEGLGDGDYTLEVVDAEGVRLTERSPVQITAPAEGTAPALQAPEEISAGNEIAIGGTGYETDTQLGEDGAVTSYGTVKVKVTDPSTGEVVDEKLVELNEDGSFDYALDTGYSATGFQRLVITVTERDGTSTTRTELVNVKGNGTPVVEAPNVVQGQTPAVGGTKLIPGEEYTFRVAGPDRDTTVTLVAGEDGKVSFRLADDLSAGEYTVEVTSANGAPVPGQSSTFRVLSDSDGDGIADENDSWDGPGATMPDSDGDGIEDSQDGWDGPGATMPDSDGDGIEDSQDGWDGPGATMPDSDGDGIHDDQDLYDGPGATMPDSDGDGIEDSQDGWDGPGATMPDSDGDGIHDDQDLYDGPGAKAPIVIAPVPTPVTPAPPVVESPELPVPDSGQPTPGEGPDQEQAPGQTPVVTDPVDGSLGGGAPVPDVVTAPGSEAPDSDNGPGIEPVSLVEKIFGDEDSESSEVVNNLEQRLDASPVRDTIEKTTGMSFSRDLSERGNFQAAPNLGDVLEMVQTAAPGLDADPVPMAAAPTTEETDEPEVIDLRDAAPRAAERAGALDASDAYGPAGLAILGLLGAGVVGGAVYVTVRRGRADHSA